MFSFVREKFQRFIKKINNAPNIYMSNLKLKIPNNFIQKCRHSNPV